MTFLYILVWLAFIFGIIALLNGKLSFMTNRKQALGFLFVCLLTIISMSDKVSTIAAAPVPASITNSPAPDQAPVPDKIAVESTKHLKELLELGFSTTDWYNSIETISFKKNKIAYGYTLTIQTSLYDKESNKEIAKRIENSMKSLKSEFEDAGPLYIQIKASNGSTFN